MESLITQIKLQKELEKMVSGDINITDEQITDKHSSVELAQPRMAQKQTQGQYTTTLWSKSKHL